MSPQQREQIRLRLGMVAAERDLAGVHAAANGVHVSAVEVVTDSLGRNWTMLKKRTDDRHAPGYNATKQREYRAKKKDKSA